MGGLYIHIPYCKKVCYYCDFHFSVALKNKDKLLEAILREMDLRKFYLNGKAINSIYFGGGTPSILSIQELSRILETIHRYFQVDSDAEITLEANPDDLSEEYLSDLQKLGITRLSIGIQSFNDKDLTWMNRRHTAKEAENSIKLSQDAGFNNINIDLIYGLPVSTPESWKLNLQKFVSFNIPHLSAYHLTIEPKTVLGIWKKRGKVTEIAEEQSIKEYEQLLETTNNEAYIHYEVSNFCREGFYSKHNLNYWNQGEYIGFGPSAHSFDGKSRQWNIALNDSYIQKIESKGIFYEIEFLSETEKYNDYILTRLRTLWGVNMLEVRDLFGEYYFQHLKKALKQYSDSDLIYYNRDEINLTDKGMFVADGIIEKLMYA